MCIYRGAFWPVFDFVTGEMGMLDDKELAAIIARKIFEAGGTNVERIQFMIGKNPERAGAGYGEGPLADHIERILNKYRSY